MRVHDELDVFGTVLEMRENRCHMVQSEVRVYVYVNLALTHSMVKRTRYALCAVEGGYSVLHRF